ncbi:MULTISPECIES: hypothetical protein [unclassified Streptomyces]|uniref:hypothetical protein n=1 Tax=unclassified Streptomyces TaxID=2593676 RepID=UPI00131A3C92|nr:MULTISPECIES: hypothetical protein [unclassified Streptomyces]MYT34053.1 hypothetical protein [Streptomyces sp. SID8354]
MTDTQGGATGRGEVRHIPFERIERGEVRRTPLERNGRGGVRRIPFEGIGLVFALAVSVTGIVWTAGVDETGVEVAPSSPHTLRHPSAAPAPPRAPAPTPSPPRHTRPSRP